MKLIRSVMALGLVLGATAFVPADAEAALMLRLTQGATIVEVTDGDALDANPLEGAVTFVGPVGTFLLNVSTGVSYPQIGSETDPHMDLNSIDTSTAAGGTLVIENIYVDGFTALPGSFTMLLGGTTSGTVVYDAFADGSLIDSLGPFGPGAFADSGGGSVAVGTPYTLTQRVTITHEGAGLTSFDAELLAPEPASLALFALGLFGVGASARRRRRNG